jgi:hypothetical protein
MSSIHKYHWNARSAHVRVLPLLFSFSLKLLPLDIVCKRLNAFRVGHLVELCMSQSHEERERKK